MEIKSIVSQLEEICEDICDHYCKYPTEYRITHDSTDVEYERLLEEKCENCPLNKIR